MKLNCRIDAFADGFNGIQSYGSLECLMPKQKLKIAARTIEAPSTNRAAAIGSGSPKKIIHEKTPQGCCGTNCAQPKTCADSAKCEKRGQSMLRSRNSKTTPKRIVNRFYTLSAIPTNLTLPNAPEEPKSER